MIFRLQVKKIGIARFSNKILQKNFLINYREIKVLNILIDSHMQDQEFVDQSLHVVQSIFRNSDYRQVNIRALTVSSFQ